MRSNNTKGIALPITNNTSYKTPRNLKSRPVFSNSNCEDIDTFFLLKTKGPSYLSINSSNISIYMYFCSQVVK